MKSFTTIFFLSFLQFFPNYTFSQEPLEMPLYGSQSIPNSIPGENREKTEINEWKVSFTTETSVPTLTLYAPEAPNGIAVVICPGGGYFGTAGDHEGKQVAEALRALGVTAFVLKYRIPDDRYCIDKSLAPLQDAQQAIRLVRKNAAEWKINPEKIGIMGFSAGGHLAASTATHFSFQADKTNADITSTRPDFAILIYPVISLTDSLGHEGSRVRLLGAKPSAEQICFFSNELQVTPQTPPVFLLHTQDDFVKVENSLQYFEACLRNGVSAEMHIFPKGGHGYGLKYPQGEGSWVGLLEEWLKQL